MSGTSLDGMDAALVDFSQSSPRLVDFLTLIMPAELKQQLQQLNQQPKLTLAHFCQLQVDIADLAIQATQQLLDRNQLKSSQIRAIGSHGQTLFHAPEIGMSLQVGHPAWIAKQTGISTVADFRIDDLALGGQGAPLAPAFHQVLMQNEAQPVALVNIGGIANISYINHEQVLGFDTGPGNGLMDEFCQATFHQPYDRSGLLAAQGQPHQALLSHLMQTSFLQQPPPKSTGRDLFNQTWLTEQLAHVEPISDLDLIATLNLFSAQSIVQGLNHLPTPPKRLWVCGGGSYNQTLLNNLQTHLPYPIQSTQEMKVDPQAIEAMLCAWLAKQRLVNQTIPLKSTTGANRNAILGGLWQP